MSGIFGLSGVLLKVFMISSQKCSLMYLSIGDMKSQGVDFMGI
jgi:hypothetical protein